MMWEMNDNVEYGIYMRQLTLHKMMVVVEGKDNIYSSGGTGVDMMEQE